MHDHEKKRADDDDGHRQVVLSADRLLFLCCAGAHVVKARGERADDCRHRLEQGDKARGGDSARAHRPNISGPKIAWAHLRDGNRARINRMRQVLAEEVNQRHQHQPGENAASKDDAGHARSDDVTNAKILRRCVGLDRCALQDVLRTEVGLVLGRARPRFEDVVVLEQGVKRAETETEEDAAGQRAATFARDQHICAGCAFRVGQGPVFFDNELAAQRNHEQHAKPAADQREQKDARVFEIESKKDQRWQREDDA